MEEVVNPRLAIHSEFLGHSIDHPGGAGVRPDLSGVEDVESERVVRLISGAIGHHGSLGEPEL
jgi:hypothetical protein